MDLKTLTLHLRTSINSHRFNQLHCSSTLFNQSSVQRRCRNQRIRISPPFRPCKLLIVACFSPSKEEVISEELDVPCENGLSVSSANDGGEGETELIEHKGVELDEKDSIWDRIVEILKFTGPATGLWICGPFMSLIDTVVIGQCSSLELAALGPGTVLCDNVSYVFMFLAIATSNMVATALARQDKEEVQQLISKLIFIGLACGVAMLFFTKFLGTQALTAFTGSKNAHIIPAANTYVQIRGLAWPIGLVGWVTQSASLGMKDAWGPLKALAAATVVNGIGDVVLCLFLGYGIAGAAWATMASQVVAGYIFIESLNEKGYNALAISVPSPSELLQILAIATPVFVTMMSKVAFYSLMVYFATSMGTHIVAAHQVMIQLYGMCAACAEPLSQTAQSFMPELLYGVGRSLPKARALLKSLLVLGALGGLVLGCIGTFVPFMFPNLFSPDPQIIRQMKTILIPFFLAMCVGPSIHSLEGTLLAGRDLKFLSLSMSGCFLAGSLFLLLLSSRGFGLSACWLALVGFQWSRFFISLRRLLAPEGILFSEISSTQHQFGNLGAA